MKSSEVCPTCNGTGKRYSTIAEGYVTDPCTKCNGTGKVSAPIEHYLRPGMGTNTDCSCGKKFSMASDAQQHIAYHHPTPAAQLEALTPLSDKALDTLISDLGHDLSTQPGSQEVETRFLAELKSLGRKYDIRSLRNDPDKTNDSNVEEFKQGVIVAFRDAIDTAAQVAYERGRIAEAKTCEQAQRHDVKAAVKQARIEELRHHIANLKSV